MVRDYLEKHWVGLLTLLILATGFALRLALAAAAPHPGIADPNHYYNLAQSLREGRGFVIDYIWQYHLPPADVTHPIDHWMPLTAVWPAVSQAVFGRSVFAALLPSVVAGGLLPLLSAYIAGRLGAGRAGRLFALASTAFVPEFILNSVRTDTTIFYIWFVGLSLLALHRSFSPSPPDPLSHEGRGGTGERWRAGFLRFPSPLVGFQSSYAGEGLGVRGNRPTYLTLSGALAGLAHLTRQDGILLAGVFVLYTLIFRRRVRWRYVWLFPAGWLVVLGPWMARNAIALGEPMPAGVTRSLFLTTLVDQYSYAGEFSLQSYLEWGIGNIVGKRLFEMAASIKLIYTLPGAVLSIAAAVGLGEPVLRRIRGGEPADHPQEESARLRLLAPPLLTLAVFFGFYTMLAPFLSQGGSFKKSYMAVMPYLIALGAFTVERYITARRARVAVMVLTCAMLLLDGLVLVKNDFAFASSYLDFIHTIKDAIDEAGDVNGDGEIIVMTEDPFVFDYVGLRALMTPNDSLDVTLDVAARYGVDYIIMPTDRKGLIPVYNGEQTDPRLTADDDVRGTHLSLYRVNLPPGAD